MRQTGLTAGNLSSHTSKLEAAGYIEVAGGVCGQKAAYDAQANRCWEGGISGVSGGDGAGAFVKDCLSQQPPFVVFVILS